MLQIFASMHSTSWAFFESLIKKNPRFSPSPSKNHLSCKEFTKALFNVGTQLTINQEQIDIPHPVTNAK